MPLERDIQRAILKRLQPRSDVTVWRQNTGGHRLKEGSRERFVRYGIPGQADISGVIKGGRALFIEVKRPGGKQSDNQKRFQVMVERYGAAYILTDDPLHCMAELDRIISTQGGGLRT